MTLVTTTSCLLLMSMRLALPMQSGIAGGYNAELMLAESASMLLRGRHHIGCGCIPRSMKYAYLAESR